VFVEDDRGGQQSEDGERGGGGRDGEPAWVGDPGDFGEPPRQDRCDPVEFGAVEAGVGPGVPPGVVVEQVDGGGPVPPFGVYAHETHLTAVGALELTMPGWMNDDHLWEQGELVDWPRDERGGLRWQPLGGGGAVVEPSDADLEAFEAWLEADDARPRDEDGLADLDLYEQAAEARRRAGTFTIRKPWEVDPVGATSRRTFGWCGDNTWAVTRWAHPKYL
jgi:hypothetical protein